MSIVVNKTRLPVTEWQTASGSVVSISDARKRNAKSLSVALEPIQDLSHGDPSPTNICPISGRSSVSVYDDPKYGGKIWWNQLLQEKNFVASYSKFGLLFTKVSGKTAFDISGTFSYSSGDRNAYIFSLAYNVPIVQNHIYYASESSQYANIYVYGVSFDNNFVNKVPHGGTIVKANASGNLNCSLHFGSNITNGTVIDETVYINLFDLTEMFGETVANNVYAMDYANKGDGVAWFRNLFPNSNYDYNAGTETLVSAVNGDPYISVTVQLGQTVYDGTVDLVSGVMTVTKALQTWTKCGGAGSAAGCFYVLASVPITKSVGRAIATYLKTYNGGGNSSNMPNWSLTQSGGGQYTIWCKLDSSYTTKTDFDNFLTSNPLPICYELATPQTIQLSPTQIEMLMRNNTVWSDAGQVTLEYARIHQ